MLPLSQVSRTDGSGMQLQLDTCCFTAVMLTQNELTTASSQSTSNQLK